MRTVLATAFTLTLQLAFIMNAGAQPSITKESVGTVDGSPVELFTLRNNNGMEARITNYGGTLVALTTPDRNGQFADVVLGFDDVKRYQEPHPVFGSIVGRYANRIARGKFTLDGKEYTLAVNNGPNHLHGGLKGFDKVVWTAEIVTVNDGPALRLTYVSADMEEGYPGTLTAVVTYSLTDENALRIDYEAATDKPTVVNLTNHAYFNLKGAGAGDVLDHELTLFASHFTPTDEGLIPTGEIRSVEGTPLDFRSPTRIGERIDADYEPLKIAGGYDHNFVIDQTGEEPRLAARVKEPTSGRIMEVYTTQPGVQLYTANFLNRRIIGKGGIPYDRRYGFCLETQHFPDSPNKPNFPSVVLRPEEKYSETTIFKFTAE